ncbi:MAG: hypothetical protein H0W83_16025, partial [Planctomycetes bacterium]|nr:hypothetical protein [Planctomycetota bacterium]
MTIQRTCAWFVVLIASAVFTGCHLTGELWIDAEGSGHGTIAVSHPPPGIEVADARRQLEKAGFIVTRISGKRSEQPVAAVDDHASDLDRALAHIPKALEGIDAEIRWDHFEQPFRRRSVEHDGSVLLDFGLLDPDVTMIVHLPGRIDTAESFGTATGRRTITFTHGLAKVRYRPAPLLRYLAAAAAGIAITTV